MPTAEDQMTSALAVFVGIIACGILLGFWAIFHFHAQAKAGAALLFILLAVGIRRLIRAHRA